MGPQILIFRAKAKGLCKVTGVCSVFIAQYSLSSSVYSRQSSPVSTSDTSQTVPRSHLTVVGKQRILMASDVSALWYAAGCAHDVSVRTPLLSRNLTYNYGCQIIGFDWYGRFFTILRPVAGFLWHAGFFIAKVAMLSGSTVTTAWRVHGLRIEETASRYGG
jgi:hypothetical protein